MSGLFNTGKLSQLNNRLSDLWANQLDTLMSRLTPARAGYLDLINTYLDAKISEVGSVTYNSVYYTVNTNHSWHVGFAGLVLVSGAAGGGGGAAITTLADGGYGGGGGAACARMPIWVDQSISASISVTIGGGGAGATVQATGGSSGGTTSLGSLISLTGGGGGSAGVASSSPANGSSASYSIDGDNPTGRAGGVWSGKTSRSTGGQGNSGSGDGGYGGGGMTPNYRVASLDNVGTGGNPSSGYNNEGGGGGGSWGRGGANGTQPTKGGGGAGADDAGAMNGASGFILLEWWT